MSNGPTKPCTNVGQPGNNVQLPTPIPNNVLCTLMGYAQTAANITVAVINSNGQTVASISKSGTAQAPTPMTASSGAAVATFNSGTDKYSIQVTSSSGQTASVLLSYAPLSYGTTTYEGSYILIAEDSPQTGDCDFNDCTAYLAWNLFVG